MINKRFTNYPDDTDYTTNAPSYYDDLARKQKLIELLAKKIWKYEETLDLTLKEISIRLESYIDENDNLMRDRLEQWDLNLEKFPENVELLLQEWLSDGTLDHIINDTIFNWKLDTSIFEQFRDSTTAHLQQKGIIPIKLPEETDWTNAINRALLQAKAEGHKKIYFPAGVYEHTGLNITDFEHGTIDGDRGATLKLSPGAVNHNIEVNSAYVTIKNVTVEGNLTIGELNPPDIRGVYFNNARGCSLVNVYVHKTKGIGVVLGNVNHAVNVLIRDTGREGFLIGGDCILSACQTGVTGLQGFNFQGSHTTATGVYAWMSGNNEISNINNPDADGIYIAGNNISITGFNVLASNRHGVYTGNSYGNNISGNVDRCGRGVHENEASGVYLNNTKASVYNVSVSNNTDDSVDDAGWTGTGVYVHNPNLGSVNNIINVTVTKDVATPVGTSDPANLENTNYIGYYAKENRSKYKTHAKGAITTNVEHSTATFPTYTTSSLTNVTQNASHLIVDYKGVYAINVYSTLASGSDGLRVIQLHINDINVGSIARQTSGSVNEVLSMTTKLKAGDAISVRYFQNSGSELALTSSIELNYIHD